MTSDLHIHPLDHKYYFEMGGGFSRIVLDDEDRRTIRDVVEWCCHDRGLDTVALTDHDMIQSSLYAAEYVKESGLPIEIITGAECTVTDPCATIENTEVHLLCLGVQKLPKYNSQTPVDKMIAVVHGMGGYVIMSHPIKYPESFRHYCHLLDGYEYNNGGHPPFEEGKNYVREQGLSTYAYNNSDYHYKGAFIDAAASELQHNIYEKCAPIFPR